MAKPAEKWFAVYRVDSGELVSIGTSVAETLPGTYATLELAGPQPADRMWNPATRAFDVPVVGPRTPEAVLAADPEFAAMTAGEKRLAGVLLRALRAPT